MAFAIFDASAPYSYIFRIPITYWYVVTLSAKLLVAIPLVTEFTISETSKRFIAFLVLVCILSAAINQSNIEDIGQFLAFCAELLLTICVIRRSNLLAYTTVSVYTIFLSTIIYICVLYSGGIEAEWGRYSYFGDSHPNLGSEIIGISIILATFTMDIRRFIIVFIPSIYAILEMQGRSAILASFIALFCVAARYMTRYQRHLLLYVGAPISILLLATFWQQCYAIFVSVFLVDDQYRGIDTGFVGRADLWGVAWALFEKSPIVGNGAGFFNTMGDVTAHNFFLYGLVEFGVLSLPVFWILAKLLTNMLRGEFYRYSALSALPIYWIFNARFMNINPYPFLMFAVAFAYDNSGELKKRSGAATVRRTRVSSDHGARHCS